MQESSTKGPEHPSVLQFRQDLETQLRQQVREAIETVLQVDRGARIRAPRAQRATRRVSPRGAGTDHHHGRGPTHAARAARPRTRRQRGDEGVS